MGRNKSPSENTIRILCGKAAGMCEFEGCDKRLFYDNVTLSEFNNAYVAHIIASSPKGPRGEALLSAELSDKLDNLMLMCADHHSLIDKSISGPRDYPVERLKAMKKNHEEKIDKLCSMFYIPKTEIVLFSSPIKGKIGANVDYKQAAKAIIPDKQPASSYGTTILVSSVNDYTSVEYWTDCSRQLQMYYDKVLFNPYIQLNIADFSLFPIAPIPLIVKLGELIGDKIPCDIYQKTREPDTWCWQSKKATNSFAEELTIQDAGSNIALILSLTNDIQIDRIPDKQKYKSIYKIKASQFDVDCIGSKSDLSLFWHQYQHTCEKIINTYGTNCSVDLFPAMPVSAAFEVGRRYMPNIYPKITIFDDCNGFFKTLTIGGKNND